MPATIVGSSAPPSRSEPFPRGRTPAGALFRRLLLMNALVFVAGAAVLALSPATVSTPVAIAEVSVLTVGAGLMLGVNALMLRVTLRPLDGLTALMERVDLLRPGERLEVSPSGDVGHLLHTFNEMLDRLETERGRSSAQALAAQEGERQRIAQELHDEIGQSLTAVLLGLKRSVDRAPSDLREELRIVQELVRTSLDEVRQVARRLRPGVLEDLGLVSAMSALAADFTQVTGLPVIRRLDQGLPVLTREAELVLYRVAQEALTNIARHAGAGRAELSLTDEGGGVLLLIADDGRGLRDSHEGAGIRGMRERAILVNAALRVGPAAIGGTEIRLLLPVGTQPT